MGKRKRPGAPAKSSPEDKSLKEPEKLSPIPAAAPAEEPQVGEVLTPNEKRECIAALSENAAELRCKRASP